METILDYRLQPDPNPFTVGTTNGQLSLIVANPEQDSIKLEGIIVTIYYGSEQRALTDEPENIELHFPQGWKKEDSSISSSNHTFSFVLGPKEGDHMLIDGQSSRTFKFTNININNQGIAEIKITEGTVGNPVVQKTVSKFPEGWGEVSFHTKESNATNEANVELIWKGPKKGTYRIEYLDSKTQRPVAIPLAGQAALDSQGSYPGPNDPPLTINRTTTFTLYVTAIISGKEFITEIQQQVTLGQIPSVLDFSGSISGQGLDRKLTLDWTTSDNTDHIIASWTNYPMNKDDASDPFQIPFKESYWIMAQANNGKKSERSFVNLNWKVIETFEIKAGYCDVAITPDNRYALVSNYGYNSDGKQIKGKTVTVIDLIKLKIVKTIITDTYIFPSSIVCTKDGKSALVACLYFPKSMILHEPMPGSSHVPMIDLDTFEIYFTNNVNLTTKDINYSCPSILKLTSNGKYGIVQLPSIGLLYAFDVGSPHRILHQKKLHSPSNDNAKTDTMTITPDDAHVLSIINKKGVNSLTKIDLDSFSVIGKPLIINEGQTAHIIETSKDGKYAIILQSDLGEIIVVDIDSLTIVHTHKMGPKSDLNAVALTPDGRFALVVDRTKNSVWMVDLETMKNDPRQLIVGNEPSSIAIAPNHEYAVVLNYQDGTMSKISLESFEVLDETVNVGPNPTNILFTRHDQSNSSQSKLNYALVTNTSISKEIKSTISILALELV